MTQNIHLPPTLLTKIGDERYRLDLRGYTCPYPQLYTIKALSQIELGAILEIEIDNPPSTETVPRSIKNNGQEYLGTEKVGASHWIIRAKKTR
ncbi:MAG: sulfurtransferase TusA family protein [Nitrososphaerota archaeon]|nr:sulfurtransferase TusA family protein [Candidatus Calditenuaceae archaeon]MDW8073448.1 sulfurtransferase TusA family protein [Nitrososphaerota archaeon]